MKAGAEDCCAFAIMRPAAATSSVPPTAHVMSRFIVLSFLVHNGSMSGAERFAFKAKLNGGLLDHRSVSLRRLMSALRKYYPYGRLPENVSEFARAAVPAYRLKTALNKSAKRESIS